MHGPDTLRLRRADAHDADTVAAFNIACARESEGLALDPERAAAGVAAALADPARGRYYLAEDDSGPLGQIMITFEWSDWRNAWFWWLQSVYVRADARRRGVFRALLAHVEAQARADRAAALRLYVDLDNHGAERTYRSAGFERAHYRMMERSLAADA